VHPIFFVPKRVKTRLDVKKVKKLKKNFIEKKLRKNFNQKKINDVFLWKIGK